MTSSANLAAIDKSPLAAITGAANGPVAPATPSTATSEVTPQLVSHPPRPNIPSLRGRHTRRVTWPFSWRSIKSGNVTHATVITGPPILRDAALQAVRQWKYQPLGGQATQATVLVTLRFRL